MSAKGGRQPVIWALGRYGSLFQRPLIKALSLDGPCWAVAARDVAHVDYRNTPELILAAPRTVGRLGSAPSFALSMLSDRAALAKQLRARAEIVHVVMISPWDVWYLKAARMAGVPTIVTIHDATRHPGEENRILDKLAAITLRYADHVVCLSQHVYDEFRRQREYTQSLHLVEGGLLVRTEPELPPRTAPRGRPLKILFSGRIRRYKGLDILLDSLRLLEERGVFFQVTVAGSGDLGPYADALKQHPKIELINRWISDQELCEILADHDVMAMPYIEASQSAVALDAQWAAMPVVATPVGGLTEQLTQGVDALFGKEASAIAFADALEQLLGDPALFATLSRGSHDSFQRVSLRPVANKWRALYDHILAA